MKIKMMRVLNLLFIAILILFLISCSKDQESNFNQALLTYHTVDTLSNPIPGAKVVLFENFLSQSIRKDSGITNSSGYISFAGLSEGRSYWTSSSLGCLSSDLTPNIAIIEFHPNIDTLPIYLVPTGHLSFINSSSFTTKVWSKNTLLNLLIPANTNKIYTQRSSADTIFWAKWNATINDYEPPIHDTVVNVTCNSTSSITIHY